MRLEPGTALWLIFILVLLVVGTPLLTGYSPVVEYTGELKDGVPHGHGTWTHPDGASYTGQFENGLWHGHGTWTNPDGISYTGEWRFGKFHGQGTLTYPGGYEYTGAWKEDLKHGYGTMTWPDGRQYTGYWEDDRMHGFGTMLYADGSSYEGEWENGLRHGRGTMTCPDGTASSGNWLSGEFQAVKIETITLDHAALTLTAGGEPATLTVLFDPEDATNQNVTWESGNSAVAAVEQGVVTPLAPGTAEITATSEDGGLTASCAVTVRPATVAVTGVRLNHTHLTLTAGTGSITLIATIIPANATNKVVTWSSSNPNAASVRGYGVVTPVNPGYAVITVRAVDGGWTAQCRVEVAAPQPVEPDQPDDEANNEEDDDEENNNNGNNGNNNDNNEEEE